MGLNRQELCAEPEKGILINPTCFDGNRFFLEFFQYCLDQGVKPEMRRVSVLSYSGNQIFKNIEAIQKVGVKDKKFGLGTSILLSGPLTGFIGVFSTGTHYAALTLNYKNAPGPDLASRADLITVRTLLDAPAEWNEFTQGIGKPELTGTYLDEVFSRIGTLGFRYDQKSLDANSKAYQQFTAQRRIREY